MAIVKESVSPREAVREVGHRDVQILVAASAVQFVLLCQLRSAVQTQAVQSRVVQA